MRPTVPDVQITDPLDAQMAVYRMISGRAVGCLIFGLMSPLALVDPAFWLIPLLGMVFGRSALRQIRQNAPAISGRKMALTGLVLSAMFLAAGPADWYAHRWMLRNEGRRFAALWFKYLAQGEPHKAYQLMLGPDQRRPLDERLWDYYRGQPAIRDPFEQYVAAPLTRTLLALGPGAEVRFYEPGDLWWEKGADEVDLCFAVTYEENHERKSFFVQLGLTRMKLPKGGAGWWIARLRGGARPPGL